LQYLHLLSNNKVGTILLEIIPELLERQGFDVEQLLEILNGFTFEVLALDEDGTPTTKMSAAELRHRHVGNYVAVRQEIA
jgi:hypothetical protein